LIARRQTRRLDLAVTQSGEEGTSNDVGGGPWIATVSVGSQPTVELLKFRGGTFSIGPSRFKHATRSER
jgi:hypothetical protein